MTLGTAGHVDHGKSALVEALTGVHPDRLAEEQRRGMTLDLGFGHMDLEGIAAGIVDVPGHERFLHTMLAGAAGVDVVLLVVAADAGVQPQTEEHFHTCRLLGLPRGVVALSKCDLASAERREEVRAEVARLVAGSFLEMAPVVEVSARSGAGLAELRAALAHAARLPGGRDAGAPMRLPIDRAFQMKGHGVVVTGTLLGGSLAPGEAVLEPAGGRLRVRAVEVHGRPVAEAHAGERTAANLTGVGLAGLRRGMVLAEPDVFVPTRELDAEVTWLAAVPPQRARLHFHLHAAETVATLIVLEPTKSTGMVQLRLAEAVVAAPGDRFILRQLSPPATLGGGRVLDPHPRLHRSKEYGLAAEGLRRLAAAGPDEALRWHLQRAGADGMAIAGLAAATGRRRGEVLAALARLPAVLDTTRGRALDHERMQELERRLVDACAEFHGREPLQPGATLAQLAPGGDAGWLGLAAERLRAAGRLEAVPGTAQFRLPGRAPAITPAELQLREQLVEHYRRAGLAAPLLPEVLAAFPQAATRPLLAGLAREGVLIECQPGWFVHAEALAGLRAELDRRRATHPRFSVPEFKQWTGLSRKHAIPLLEYLDRVRVTRRAGDTREIG